MHRVLLVLGIVVVAIALIGYCNESGAQQPAEDPALATAKQLLTEANNRVIGMSAEIAKLTSALHAAQAQIEKRKAEDNEAAKPKKE